MRIIITLISISTILFANNLCAVMIEDVKNKITYTETVAECTDVISNKLVLSLFRSINTF